MIKTVVTQWLVIHYKYNDAIGFVDMVAPYVRGSKAKRNEAIWKAIAEERWTSNVDFVKTYCVIKKITLMTKFLTMDEVELEI